MSQVNMASSIPTLNNHDGVPLPPAIPVAGQILTAMGMTVKSVYYNPSTPAKVFKLCQAVPGIFIAGGAVTAAIETCVYNAHSPTDQHVLAQTNPAVGDIDVYAIGDRDEKLATVARLITYLQPKVIRRSECAVTLYLAKEDVAKVFDMEVIDQARMAISMWMLLAARKIQVILDTTSDMQGILNSYDLDCCQCATDGAVYHLTQRCIDAHTSHCNKYIPIMTPERAAKYMCRGYDIVDAPEEFVTKATSLIAIDNCTFKYTGSPLVAPYENASDMGISASNSAEVIVNKTLDTLKKAILSGDPVPAVIVGCGEEATFRMVTEDTQPPITLSDWMYRTLNAACEFSEMNTYGGEKAGAIRAMIAEDIEDVTAVIGKIRVPPAYSETMVAVRERLSKNK